MHRRLLPWLEPFPLAWTRLFSCCAAFSTANRVYFA